MKINKKGISNVFFLAVFCFAVIIPSFLFWMNSLNETAIDENYMEKSSIGFYEWRKIMMTNSANIIAKAETTEEKTALSGKYTVNISFGKKNENSMPIKITVSDGNKKPFILERSFLLSKSADRFLLNDTTGKNVAMQWYPSEELIKFLVEGKEIVEESSDDFSRGNGYIIFDNGLILQWGVINTNFDGGVKNAYFAKKFPNKCLTVVTSVYQSHYIGGIRFNSVRGYDNTHAEFVPTGGYGNYKIFWMAFGH